MPDTRLTARPALDGYHKQFGDTALSEVTGQALVSIAIPLGGADALRAAMNTAYGTSFPAPGSSTLSKDGTVRFLGLQQDQCFALFGTDSDSAVETVAGALGDTGYYTDQSDSWAVLRLSGALALTALERICPLDLSPSEFPPGSVARTVMEHLGVIILCEDTDRYLLMSARSSAPSFLHAVETSVENVV